MASVVINLPPLPINRLDSVDTIADLRAVPSASLDDGQDIAVDGSVSVGDGLGGIYTWSELSVLDDNGTTVIKPDDVPPLSAGRWILISASGNTQAKFIGTEDFSGDIIPNGSTAQEALQALETATEGKASKSGDVFSGMVGFEDGVSGTIAAPAFSSGVYTSYHTFNAGGLDFALDYANEQAGLAATDSVTAALKVTGGTIHQTNAFAAYLTSTRAKPVTNGGDVAIYTHAKAAGDNANVFSLNTLASDTAGFTNQTLQNELDINVFDPSTNVQGLGLVLNSIQSMVNAPLGYVCRIANTTQWGACFYTTDGASQIAFHAGALGTVNNVFSQVVEFVSRSTGGTTYTSSIRSDPNASLLLKSGAVGAAIGFQDSAGTVMGFVNGSGFGTSGSGTFGAAVTASLNSATGVAPFIAENGNSTSTTGKYVEFSATGRDTVNAAKTAGSLRFSPGDANWVDASASIYIRRSDASVPGLVLLGQGSPEGVLSAPVGAIYTRSDGGAGTTLYVKESGTGNTGWTAK